MTLNVIWTSRFKKDYKLAIKRGFDIEKIDSVIRTLSRCESLLSELQDHALQGEWKGFRECHIAPDWLLIYAVQNDALILTLARTGSHSDLFDR